jgi:hypothetical protein
MWTWIRRNAIKRHKIKVMLNVLEAAGGTTEDMNTLLTAGFRKSLGEAGLSCDFMAVRVLLDVFRKGQLVGLHTNAIPSSTNYGGPPIQKYFSTKQERDAAARKTTFLSCWLGASASTPVLLACAQAGATAIAGEMQEGVIAAKIRAIEQATKIYQESMTLLQDASAILQRSLDQNQPPAVSADALRALYDRTENYHDVTSYFVQRKIWDMCNKMRQKKAGDEWQGALREYMQMLTECKVETKSR